MITGLFDGDLVGVHDLRGDGTAVRHLRAALPRRRLFNSDGLTVTSHVGGHSERVHVSLAGRVNNMDQLCRALGRSPDAPPEDALAAGYERWGEGLLELIRGHFALVCWDRRMRRGVLAQDQLGGRSLFTFTDGPRLYFATEVALLLRLLPRRPEADETALAYHLIDHSVPDGQMLYRGMRRLGAGRHLRLTDRDRSEGRHWAPRYAPPLELPRPELAVRLRDELATAVRLATPGAGRSALLLSGGIDSSVVAALAAQCAPDLRAFAAAFPDDPQVDETRWARKVAERTGLTLTAVPIDDPKPLDAARAYLRAWALPLPAPGLVIEQPLTAEALRTGAQVLLDGQGGDELLGPAHFVIADRLRRARPVSAWRLARRYPGLGAHPSPRHVRLVLASVGVRGAIPPRLHEHVRRRRGVERYTPAWLRAGPARRFVETEDPWRWKRLDGPRWWASLADTLTRGRERADIADYVRRRARMNGLDGRSPLLDLGLVEFVLRLPPESNFNPVLSRPLVRLALEGALPPDVLARRDKSNFTAYYHRLLSAQQTLAELRALLDPRCAAVGEYVDLQRAQRLLLDDPPGVGRPGWRRWGEQVWNIATAEMWLRACGA